MYVCGLAVHVCGLLFVTGPSVATAHNKTMRPQMPLMMPAVGTNGQLTVHLMSVAIFSTEFEIVGSSLWDYLDPPVNVHFLSSYWQLASTTEAWFNIVRHRCSDSHLTLLMLLLLLNITLWWSNKIQMQLLALTKFHSKDPKWTLAYGFIP